MKVYSTMSRKKEEFIPINNNKVNLFVCGPTVYDDAHIGHGRTYISFDMIKRYLEYLGYSVFYIENITDIDDKIINRSKELINNPNEFINYSKHLALKYEKRFKEDMESLNIKGVNIYPRATDYINEIIDQIQRLIDKGFAYIAETGVYFEVNKFKDFGKLSNRKIDKLITKRIKQDKSKNDPKDFALWKLRNGPDYEGEPVWDSPWGKGRPGWHIEDTAITEQYFSSQYDIHGGGLDLIFPHHEAEIAQMEAVSGKSPMVNYWVHTGFLNVNGEKMSKSLGNFITIRDLLKKYSAETFRFFVLSTHYRSPIDFNETSLHQAEKNIINILNYLNKVNESLSLKIIKENGKYEEELNNLNNDLVEGTLFENIKDYSNIYKSSNYKPLIESKEKFFNSMDDDFSTPKAIAEIFHFIKFSSKKLKDLDIVDLLGILDFFNDISNIFGINFTLDNKDNGDFDALLDIINDVRSSLRDDKNYELSDEIRDKLEELDIVVSD